MMNMVKPKIPASASFFRSSTDAFQRRVVDITITSPLSVFAMQMRMRDKRSTYTGHPLLYRGR